jgi:glycosyltransferase involved in cell wall biosynthesis
MKIAFLIRSLDYGGAERQLVALAKALRRQGHEVSVAVFYGGGPLESDLRDMDVPVVTLDKRGRWDMVGFARRLIRFVRAAAPDVLHSYLGIPNILTALIKPLFPQTCMAWGVRASNMALAHYDWTARAAYLIECRLARFADLIIVNSHAGLEYAALNGFPKSTMVVIPNGIDVTRFAMDEAARARVRNEWNMTDGDILVGLVGRLDPMKDHRAFLKAAATLVKQRDDLRFVCVGDGPADYRLRLNDLGRELGLARQLIWAGARGDMPAVYNALDILVSASAYGEGFSNVVAEAMACGVPPVVTDVGDSAWLIGDCGELVPPADPGALAAAVAGLADRIARGDRRRADGRRRIAECFSVGELETRTVAALRQLRNPSSTL